MSSPRALMGPEVAALVVASAPTTRPDRPFGRLGLWFTRDPRRLAVDRSLDADAIDGDRIGERVAATLIAERQLACEVIESDSSEGGVLDAAPTRAEVVSAFLDEINLDAFTKGQLLDLASDLGIEGVDRNMRKAAIRAAIEEVGS